MTSRTRLPKKVKIGYAEYNVKHVAKKSQKRYADLGECDYTNHLITLFGNQAPSELCDSFFHECLHAIIMNFNIPFKNGKEEERYVKHFSHSLMTVFKDNPSLLDYLKYQLKLRNKSEQKT